MVTNKTSEALKEWIQNLRDGIEYDEDNGFEDEESSRAWMKNSEAIAVKYKRMADYLEVIHKESNRHFKGDEFTEVNDILRNIYMHASEALAFDPLTAS